MTARNAERKGSKKKRRIMPLEQLKRERRMPILFVGAGITRRYCNVCGWNELLESLAHKVGLSTFQLNGMRQTLTTANPDKEVNPILASELRRMMMEHISNGTLRRKDFPEIGDDEWGPMEKGDPFKVLVCRYTSDYAVTDDPVLLSEIESFKAISEKVPAVITTNYDDFLEKHIFRGFDTLVFPDDYYFSDSRGYGEILKLHGSVEKPQSIVITSEDYRAMESGSLVVMSRFVSMLCSNPVIFIGYSMSDPEINRLLADMVSTLKQTDLDKVRRHIVHVTVDPDAEKASWNYPYIEHQGKRVEITRLTVPSLKMLYDALSGFSPVATPTEIKMYMSMISDIVLSTDHRNRKVSVISPESIDKAGPKDLAVVFGSVESVNSMMRGILGYEISDVVKDVLLGRPGIFRNGDEFIAWLSDRRIGSGHKYIPVFHYMRRFGIRTEDLPEEVSGFVCDMVVHMEAVVEGISGKCQGVSCEADVDAFLSAQTKSFHRCTALAYFYSRGILDERGFRDRLVLRYQAMMDDVGVDARVTSELRCAIAYLDYKPYHLDETVR